MSGVGHCLKTPYMAITYYCHIYIIYIIIISIAITIPGEQKPH